MIEEEASIDQIPGDCDWSVKLDC